MKRKPPTKERPVQAGPDEGIVRRIIRVGGGKAMRGKRGQVVAIWGVDKSKLSATDRAYWQAEEIETDKRFRAAGGHIIDRPNPAGLLDRSKFYFLDTLTPEQIAEATASAGFTDASRRVRKLRRHASLSDTADYLSASIPNPSEEGRVSANPFWTLLAQAELLALAYDAAPMVERDAEAQLGRKRGGEVAAGKKKVRAEAWHKDAKTAARKMLAAGTPPHNISGILAKRFHKTARTMRDVLTEGGILKKRK